MVSRAAFTIYTSLGGAFRALISVMSPLVTAC